MNRPVAARMIPDINWLPPLLYTHFVPGSASIGWLEREGDPVLALLELDGAVRIVERPILFMPFDARSHREQVGQRRAVETRVDAGEIAVLEVRQERPIERRDLAAAERDATTVAAIDFVTDCSVWTSRP